MLSNISKRPLFFLLTVAAILQTVLIVFYHFNGFFGQDSYEYLRITYSLNAFYGDGTSPAYTVYPIMYPIVCSIADFFFPSTMFAMQFVSMISMLIAAYLLVKIIKLITIEAKHAHVFVLLFFVLSPYILRFSLIAMSDMFCIAMWLFTFYYSLRFEQKTKLKYLLLSSFFAGITLMTRYPSIVLLLLPAFICLKTIFRTKQYLFILPAAIAALLSTVPDLIIRQRFIFWNIGSEGPAFSYDFFADQFSFANLFKSSFFNIDGWQHYPTPNIVFGFFQFVHPAFIFCGILFLILLIKQQNRHRYTFPLLFTILLYSLFIGCNPYQNNRYLMFVVPAVLLVYYLPFTNIIWSIKQQPKLGYLLFSGVVICQLLLFSISFQKIVFYNKLEHIIADHVGKLGKLPVYTLSIDGALLAYNPNMEIINLFNTHLSEGDVQTGYLLYNPNAFSKQFEGLLPEKNYHFLQANTRLQKLTEFEGGWELYQIN